MQTDIQKVWEYITSQIQGNPSSIHGPSHWRRVERNAVLLATRTQANVTVVRLFAIFHDSCRVNDGWDDGHGTRGAEYAKSLRGEIYDLADNEFDLLHYACVWHTDGTNNENSTIATCWDADRLDLGRVGIRPDPKRMCTEFGREIARAGAVELYLKRTGTLS